MKNYWEKLLRNNLLPDPARYSNDKLYKREHRNDFVTPENLIVIIKTKWKHYCFGGSIYSAMVVLGDEIIDVIFVPPKFRGRQQYKIKWDKIEELDLHFLPKE